MNCYANAYITLPIAPAVLLQEAHRLLNIAPRKICRVPVKIRLESTTRGKRFTGTIEKLVKCRMMGARIAEVPFVLRYDRKMSSSKVVTSVTTLGYLVLIAKYIRPWGDLGALWQKQCAERRARVYREDGQLRSVDVSIHGEPVQVGSKR